MLPVVLWSSHPKETITFPSCTSVRDMATLCMDSNNGEGEGLDEDQVNRCLLSLKKEHKSEFLSNISSSAFFLVLTVGFREAGTRRHSFFSWFASVSLPPCSCVQAGAPWGPKILGWMWREGGGFLEPSSKEFGSFLGMKAK